MKYILLAFFSFYYLIGQSQIEGKTSYQTKIVVKAKGYNDSIVLRVLPPDPVSLQRILRYGYKVERLEIDNAGKSDASQSSFISPNGYVFKYSKDRINNLPNLSKEIKELVLNIAYPEAEKLKGLEIDYPEIMQDYDDVVSLSVNVISCQSFIAGQALGLTIVDREVSLDKSYLYNFTFFDENGKYHTKSVFGTAFYEKPAPIEIVEVISSNNHIRLNWDQNQVGNDYFLFDIERSTDEKSFSTVNEVPFLPLFSDDPQLSTSIVSYQDSVMNDIEYTYRIRGYSYFAEKGPDGFMMKAIAKDDIPPASPVILDLYTESQTELSIFFEGKNEENDFVGYNIYKSSALTSEWEKLNHKIIFEQKGEFIDKYFDSSVDYNYKICAVDETGNEGCSQPQKALYGDSTPPSIPENLLYEIDSLGHLTISWDENKEVDLLGYFVFSSNHPNHDFIRINGHPLKENFFKDTLTLTTLSKNKYYKLAAMDVATNTSGFSELLTVNRPDKIPPSPAIMKSATYMNDSIAVDWISSSFGDVTSQRVYRYSKSENKWNLVAELPPHINYWIDHNISQSKNYGYKVESIDDSGNHSLSPDMISVVSSKREVLKAPKIISISRKENSIEIVCDFDSKATNQILLYRSSDKTKPKLFKRLKPNTKLIFEGEDDAEIVFYTLRYESEDGVKSQFSESVKPKK